MFQGAITALITPFDNHGKVDYQAFKNLIKWQIAEGISGLVPCGTTGEAPTLSVEEHQKLIKTCVETAKDQVPVIAGTGSNSTEKTIYLTQYAKKAGATACLVVCPYYNKPSQDNLYKHFAQIAEVGLPIIAYNVPGRTGVDLLPETIAKLAQNVKKIVAIKDATADLTRPLKTRLLAGENFCQLSGEDATITAFLAQGGHGCISVTANIAPKLCSELHRFWQKGDLKNCFLIRDQLMPLHAAMFVESNPGPVKYAARLLGLADEATRPPLYGISDSSKEKVKSALQITGLLND